MKKVCFFILLGIFGNTLHAMAEPSKIKQLFQAKIDLQKLKRVRESESYFVLSTDRAEQLDKQIDEYEQTIETLKQELKQDED